MACNYVYNVFGWLGDWSWWTSFIIHNYVIITIKTKKKWKEKKYIVKYILFLSKSLEKISYLTI